MKSGEKNYWQPRHLSRYSSSTSFVVMCVRQMTEKLKYRKASSPFTHILPVILKLNDFFYSQICSTFSIFEISFFKSLSKTFPTELHFFFESCILYCFDGVYTFIKILIFPMIWMFTETEKQLPPASRNVYLSISLRNLIIFELRKNRREFEV